MELQDITPPGIGTRGHGEADAGRKRNRRAEILNAEGEKQSLILRSEGEKASKINQAEATKQAQILRAEGEAQAIILNAQAEADAILRVAEAVRSGNTDPATYMLAMKYIDTLREMTSGKGQQDCIHPLRSIIGALLNRLDSVVVSEINYISDIHNGECRRSQQARRHSSLWISKVNSW